MEMSAGAVLYTIIDNKINYLISLDFHNNWGFPKGHLEQGETSVDAAIREIKEEVGIDATLDTNFMKELIYTMPNGIEKHSIYYIGRFMDQIPSKQLSEVQDIKILPYEKALDTLSFENMKDVLIQANKYIEKALK